MDEEFVKARTQLKKEPGEIGNCGVSLDGWKSQNGYKIFVIIGHWITADFQPRHRLLDFHKPDTGENLASIVYTVLSELNIGAKLLSFFQLLGTMPVIIQQW